MVLIITGMGSQLGGRQSKDWPSAASIDTGQSQHVVKNARTFPRSFAKMIAWAPVITSATAQPGAGNCQFLDFLAHNCSRAMVEAD